VLDCAAGGINEKHRKWHLSGKTRLQGKKVNTSLGARRARVPSPVKNEIGKIDTEGPKF